MAKHLFTISNTGQTVEIERSWSWRNIVVRLDGREIGHFQNMTPLKQGQLLKTPIGDIHVQYKQSAFTGSGFEVWYDNNLLEGSFNHPLQHWKQGYQTALFLGIFNMAIGAIAMSSKSSFLTAIGAGPYSLIFGIVLLLLGLVSWQRRSGMALGLAAFIFAADGLVGLLFVFMASGLPNVFAVMVRVGFVVLMGRGAGAAWNLEPQHEKVKNSEYA